MDTMFPSAARHSLRIVVQQVCENFPQQAVYRLIAYGDHGGFRPSEFQSFDALLGTLRSAIPGFDQTRLSIKAEITGSFIVLSEVMELDNAQLSILGLTPRE